MGGQKGRSALCLFLLAWMNYMDRQDVVLPTLMACLCHELGHWGMARWLGLPLCQIRISLVGMEMRFSREMSYGQEILVALAGPVVNGILFGICQLCQVWQPFAWFNLGLACFNLLPVGGLDGGRVLTCCLTLLLGPYRAAGWVRWLEGTILVILLCCSLILLSFGGNMTLLLGTGWLLWANFRQKRRKKACHIQKKQVE